MLGARSTSREAGAPDVVLSSAGDDFIGAADAVVLDGFAVGLEILPAATETDLETPQPHMNPAASRDARLCSLARAPADSLLAGALSRSEERRVGKEC